jgi:hypothetical protein
LSGEVTQHQKVEFKAFVFYLQGTPAQIKTIDKAAGVDNIGMGLLDGPKGESVALYKINPEVRNTVLVYKDRTVTARFVNLDLSKNAAALQKAIDTTTQAALSKLTTQGSVEIDSSALLLLATGILPLACQRTTGEPPH